jgi:hypothetical protein
LKSYYFGYIYIVLVRFFVSYQLTVVTAQGSHLRTPNPGCNPGFAPPICYIKGRVNPYLNPGFGVLRVGLWRKSSKTLLDWPLPTFFWPVEPHGLQALADGGRGFKNTWNPSLDLLNITYHIQNCKKVRMHCRNYSFLTENAENIKTTAVLRCTYSHRWARSHFLLPSLDALDLYKRVTDLIFKKVN